MNGIDSVGDRLKGVTCMLGNCFIDTYLREWKKIVMHVSGRCFSAVGS